MPGAHEVSYDRRRLNRYRRGKDGLVGPEVAEETERCRGDRIGALRYGNDQRNSARGVRLGKFEIGDHRRDGNCIADAKAKEHDAGDEQGGLLP